MASVLQFASRTGPSSRRTAAEGRQDAQIIIFPGVRYERPQAATRGDAEASRIPSMPDQPVQRR